MVGFDVRIWLLQMFLNIAFCILLEWGRGFTLQCISSLLLCSFAPSGQIVLSPSSVSWLCRFRRDHHDNTLSLFKVIWKPLLGFSFPIFQTDIFLLSHRHPHPVVLSMVVEPGTVAACRHIIDASMAVIPVTIAVMVASFLFDAGLHSYFSFAKVAQASFVKYQSHGSLSLLKFSSSLPHFLLNGRSLKKMGYSVKFACYSLSLHDCFLLALHCT